MNRTTFSFILVLVLCGGFVENKPQWSKRNKEEKLFYDVGKTVNKDRKIQLELDGSPVEDTLRTLLAIRHHSSPKELGSKSYKTFLDQLPQGISPVMKHISKLVPDHIMKDDHYIDENKSQGISNKHSGDLDALVSDIKSIQHFQDPVGRGRAPSHPKFEDKSIGEISLNNGTNILSEDWSHESEQWKFKGGEWSKIVLPDPEHPGLPPTEVPGPALVAISDNPLKKLHCIRDVPKLTNMTFHFMYFLSRTTIPPTLEVFVTTKDEVSHQLEIEQLLGIWSDNNLPIPFDGPLQISFVATLWDKLNEVALDDITIKGHFEHESEISDLPVDVNQEFNDSAITNTTHQEVTFTTSSISTSASVSSSTGDLDSQVSENSNETFPNPSEEVEASTTTFIQTVQESSLNYNEVNATSSINYNTDTPDQTTSEFQSQQDNSSSSSTGQENVTSNIGVDLNMENNGSTEGTWEVFNIFLILTVIGSCILAILYWRKRRGYRDDEISVFNRHPYSDFHNPTYSGDQEEVNNSSRSIRNTDTTNNYKSFD